ncbi:MAG: transposase [Candidatus Doudnabacteria bacterium]|jgi:putative transposase
MRNRDYKIFASGGYYHVYNRGNGKQNIFLDEDDYLFFLRRMRENLFPNLQEGAPLAPRAYKRKLLPAGAFCLVSYCLMPNHFHWLIRQNTQLPVGKLLLKVCTGYSMYFNKKYEHTGHVFQDQFKAITIENDSYLVWLSAYIHQNPKIAGLVENLSSWKFCSYPDYVGQRDGILCEKNIILDNFKSQEAYADFVGNSYIKIKERKDLQSLFLE